MDKFSFSEYVVDYMKRNNIGPDFPRRRLARLLYRECPERWGSIDRARDVVRYALGSHGKGNRARARFEPVLGLDTSNPYGLPPSDPEPWEPFILPAGKRIAVMSDIHFPYHDIPAITAFVRYVEGADILLLNGDIFDMYQSSRFVRDPSKRNIAGELDIGCEAIMKIKDALGCTVIMKEGNHDERLRALIYQKAPELFGLPEASLEFLVRERADIDEWVCDKRKVMAGRLNILHGHELPQGVMSPVNIARGLYLRTKANSLCGHHHRSSYHAEMTLDEDMISCWSAGCFCHMKPNYMPINSWNHGGAIVTIAADGKNFTVDNVRIKDGRVL